MDANSSRRHVLAALLTLPAIGHSVPPAIAFTGPPDCSTWDAAMARYQATLDAFRASVDRSDEALDPLDAATEVELCALMATPAPDVKAFVFKLDLWVEQEISTWTVPDGKEITRAMLADLYHLTGEAEPWLQ